jgi:Sec-independent protein translocase protein TatA
MKLTYLVLVALPCALATRSSQPKQKPDPKALLNDPDFISNLVDRAFAATMNHNIGEMQIALDNCRDAHPKQKDVCSPEYLKAGGYLKKARKQIKNGMSKLEKEKAEKAQKAEKEEKEGKTKGRTQDKAADAAQWDGVIKQVLDSFQKDGMPDFEQVRQPLHPNSKTGKKGSADKREL